ncbi:MAG: type II toxin-antitoxin system RelE/ParE family toxin [Ignavibacteriales bacterium]|nr:type II toxin-antitoxin system RelE/ParE family toxin [Ignavibacteriales bacterium]
MYSLLILKVALKELANLPDNVYQKIRNEIRELAKNPRPVGCKKLTGRDGWRIRVGDYRVIYEIEDNQQKIIVLHVGHRKDIY